MRIPAPPPEPEEESEAEEENERACRVCGCTEFDPCPEGCAWVEQNLCSTTECLEAAGYTPEEITQVEKGETPRMKATPAEPSAEGPAGKTGGA